MKVKITNKPPSSENDAIILAYIYLGFFYAYLNKTKFRFVHRLFNLMFYYEPFFMLFELHET